jgi:hypothetical protein
MGMCWCLVALPAGDMGLLWWLLLGVCSHCTWVLCPRWQGWCCSVLVVVSWGVVFSHWVSGCVWVPGYVAQEFEGPGEQVGSKGGTAGVPDRSPPSWVSPCVFLLPVVVWHTSHPFTRGGGQWWRVCCQGVVWHIRGAAQPQEISKIEVYTC